MSWDVWKKPSLAGPPETMNDARDSLDCHATRIAAIYDIHGNLPALEAVLGDIRKARVDHLVIGGDVFPGPMPAESLDCLLEVGCPSSFILGNGDREVLAFMNGVETDWFRTAPEKCRHPIRWTAEQLSNEHQRRIATWPLTARIVVPGLGPVLFCHATPQNDTECFTRCTPDSRLRTIFAGVEERLVVCGHTHMQFDRLVDGIRVINAGSVGMPFGKPGAHWLLLDSKPRLQHTPYDLREAMARVQATRYPQAIEFAEHCMVRPPTENAMLDAFAKYDG